MKNKETKIQKNTKKNKSVKNTSKNNLGETNVDYDEVKRKLNQGNMLVAEPLVKEKTKGPTKSQINRLKKFYNTKDGYQIVHLQHILESQHLKIMDTEIQILYMVDYFMEIICYLII